MKKLHRRAVLVGLLVLTLSLTVGTAAALGAGKVTIFTGAGISRPPWIAAGPDGALWFTNHGNNSIGRITTAGKVTNYTDPSISLPYGIAAGPDGALWFTEFFGFSGGHTKSDRGSIQRQHGGASAGTRTPGAPDPAGSARGATPRDTPAAR